MLKKRILASSLASVMALSSVSVVAFADETAADYGEAVTKAVLKEYVASFDEFLKNDVFEYGTVQAEQFQGAYDYAKNVAADSKATDDEATAAYQMLKSIRESMVIRTAADLQNLIDDMKNDYDTNNILNEANNDIIWTQDSFDGFKYAYDDAKDYVNSEDGRLINTAYSNLEKAYKDLDALESVTKSQYRAVLKEYEAIQSQLLKYENWRRGTCAVNSETGNMKGDADSNKDNLLTNAEYVTYADLITIVLGDGDVDLYRSTRKFDKSTGTWHAKTLMAADGQADRWILGDGAGTADLADFIDAQYKAFNEIQSSNVTTNTDIVDAYNSAKDAVAVFKGWKPDDTRYGVKADINGNINKYRANLAKDFEQALLTSVITVVGNDANGDPIVDASDDYKVTADIKLTVDKTTNLICVKKSSESDPVANVYDKACTTNSKEATVRKGQSILKYIPIRSINVQATFDALTNTDPADNNVTPWQGNRAVWEDLAEVLKVVEAYQAADLIKDVSATKDVNERYVAFQAAYDAVVGLKLYDTNGIVSKATGSSDEWTILNRKLKYVLEDMYLEASSKTYTKKDVEKLIETAYDLAETTGDCEAFATQNYNLAIARQYTIDWLAEANADKAYKDDKTYYLNSELKDATGARNYINGFVDALKKKYGYYPVSYGEVADLIVQVANGLDDGIYGKSAASIKIMVSKLAVELSTLDALGDDNEVFSDERKFNKFNRVYVREYNSAPGADDKATDAEKQLYADYKALLKALDEVEQAPEIVLGDLDGDNVATAKDALMIVQAAVGLITLTDDQKAAADFNNDGKVTSDDALAIVKAALGLN